MTDDLDHMGPVDYLIVEFEGSRLTGEGLSLLVDLVDRRIIRVIDLLFVEKLPDGSVVELDVDVVAGELRVFAGAASGLLGEDDLSEAAGALEAGNSAAIVVYENLWAAPLARALRRAGGQLVASGRIPVQAILAALDATEENAGAPRMQPVGKG